MSTNEAHRVALINALQANDPNGSYTDDQAIAEGMEPLTLSEAQNLAIEHGLPVGRIVDHAPMVEDTTTFKLQGCERVFVGARMNDAALAFIADMDAENDDGYPPLTAVVSRFKGTPAVFVCMDGWPLIDIVYPAAPVRTRTERRTYLGVPAVVTTLEQGPTYRAVVMRKAGEITVRVQSGDGTRGTLVECYSGTAADEASAMDVARVQLAAVAAPRPTWARTMDSMRVSVQS